jgi:hypothetical protein
MNEEIKLIVNQLKQLQVTKTALLERLERLVEEEPRTSRLATAETVRATRHQSRVVSRQLAIGDRVRVLNPNSDQLDIGTVTRIGLRVTIVDRRGQDIVRDAKNLVFEDE